MLNDFIPLRDIIDRAKHAKRALFSKRHKIANQRIKNLQSMVGRSELRLLRDDVCYLALVDLEVRESLFESAQAKAMHRASVSLLPVNAALLQLAFDLVGNLAVVGQ